MMQADKAKKETQWAHLPITAGVPIGHTIIKVARDEDFTNQIGSNRFFDLVDHDKVQLQHAVQQQQQACDALLQFKR